MCTDAEGEVLIETFKKYRKARAVSECDRPALDDLRRASMITYSVRDGRLYAEASPIGKTIRPSLLKDLASRIHS